MCISNINAVANLYKSYTTNSNSTQSFENSFDTVVAIRENRNVYIEDFFVVVDYRIMGTTDENKKKDNVIIQKKPLYVKIRLTKLSSDEGKQYFLDLGEDKIDNENILHADVDYISLRKISRVKKIDFSDIGVGEFVVKVLMKTNIDDDWNIQSLTPLNVV